MLKNHTRDIDLRRPVDVDEAEFATQFYKEQWVFDQYQEDRIKLFQDVLFPLTLPDGYVIMFGTHNCQVFQSWCEQWGEKKCLGFELYNDTHHPRVVVMDVRGLGDWCDTLISLSWNDIGSWERTPNARRISYDWIKKNVVKGGFYMERGDDMADWPLSKDMKSSGFEIYQEVLGGAYVLYKKL